MHVVVAWQPNTKEPAAQNVVLEELKACLTGYSWIKPMTKTWLYIVQVDDANDGRALRVALTEVCRRNPGSFHLLVSPVIEETGYNGYLPKSTWSKIRARTD